MQAAYLVSCILSDTSPCCCDTAPLSIKLQQNTWTVITTYYFFFHLLLDLLSDWLKEAGIVSESYNFPPT